MNIIIFLSAKRFAFHSIDLDCFLVVFFLIVNRNLFRIRIIFIISITFSAFIDMIKETKTRNQKTYSNLNFKKENEKKNA